GRGPGSLGAIGQVERGDLVHRARGQRDVIPAVEQARAVDRIDGEAEALIAALDRLPLESDAHGPAWLLAEQAYERRRFIVRDDRGQQSVLHRVARKDVAEGWRDHAPDAVIPKRIHRRLARGAAAEVATAHDDLGVTPGRPVERKVRPLAPVGIEAQVTQQRRCEPGRARHLQKARREGVVGVEIGDVERAGGRGESDEFVHAPHPFRPMSSGRTSVSLPVTAAAATMAGDIRWVRASGPCRPRKLRLVVEAQRSPGATTSPLMPTHMEQPDSPHSRPASRKTRSSPSSSAWRLTADEPGDTSPGTLLSRPAKTAAAARRSSMRALVQEPMKMRSTAILASFVPGLSPM